MKKFLIIFLSFFLFACGNNSQKVAENLKAEAEKVANISENAEKIPETEKIPQNSAENTEEIIDIGFRMLKNGADKYDVSEDFKNISELEKFFKEYKLPDDIENRKIDIYIYEKYLIGKAQSTGINYYSRDIMEKILNIFKTRPDILEKSFVSVDEYILYDLDVSFIPNLKK